MKNDIGKRNEAKEKIRRLEVVAVSTRLNWYFYICAIHMYFHNFLYVTYKNYTDNNNNFRLKQPYSLDTHNMCIHLYTYIDMYIPYHIHTICTQMVYIILCISKMLVMCKCLCLFTGPVYDVFQKCGLFRNHLFACFPTVHDAVVFAQSKYIDPVHSIRL